MTTIKFRPGAVELMSALVCTVVLGACNEAGTFPEQEEICTFDAARETAPALATVLMSISAKS
jgi:hypothetical protein